MDYGAKVGKTIIFAKSHRHAEKIYEAFNTHLRNAGIKVETGEFGAMMNVEINNDGPVTLIIDSK